MGLTVLDAGEGGRFAGTCRDASATPQPIPKAAVSAFTLTLREAASGAIVNGRDSQNVLDANNCSMDATSGAFVWNHQGADSETLDPDADFEEHEAFFRCVGSFVGSPLEFSHRLLCVNQLLLCRFEDVSQQLVGGGVPINPKNEVIITLMIAGFAAALQARTARLLKKSIPARPTRQVFSPNGRTGSVRLDAWPVDEILSVKEDPEGVFGEDIADIKGDCTMTTAYHLRHRDGVFDRGIGSLEVRYAGGMARSTGGVPGHVRLMAIQQVAAWWQNKDRLGISSISTDRGTIQNLSQLPLLPWVEAQIDTLKPRVTF